ncbi:alpha/beta hydrolase [Rhodobacterales bacterium]|nr:alpha/beta hydrolase [Rhodobacterales bacterium]
MTVQIKDMTLDKVAVGPVAARVYQGAEYSKSPPVLIYFHGGSFKGGIPQECEFAQVVAETGAIVVIPDYTAPLGNVFPKPLETGFSVFSYLALKRAGLGNRKSLLLVGGVESGGNIAAAVALKARDHFADELDGQVLLSPLLDPFMGSASFEAADKVGMKERWSEGWSHYLSTGMCHPYAAPCTCSRLTGVASALVLSSEDDPLRDEALDYADHLKNAGIAVTRHVCPAGTGWPSVYGGKTDVAPSWQPQVREQFSSFVQSVSIH